VTTAPKNVLDELTCAQTCEAGVEVFHDDAIDTAFGKRGEFIAQGRDAPRGARRIVRLLRKEFTRMRLERHDACGQADTVGRPTDLPEKGLVPAMHPIEIADCHRAAFSTGRGGQAAVDTHKLLFIKSAGKSLDYRRPYAHTREPGGASAKLPAVKTIVILISGRGSNLEAIIRSCALEEWPARIVAVISTRSEAGGLEIARRAGIATHIVEHRQFPDAIAFEARLMSEIDQYEPDLVVLAGFLRILSSAFVARYAGRILNIHPSLLPAFPGLGTHRKALAAGVCVHGATVHFVTAALDCGPIVAQAVVPVLGDDTEETLAARVLAQEHRLYPRAVRAFIEGRIHLEGEHARVDEGHEPLLLCGGLDRYLT